MQGDHKDFSSYSPALCSSAYINSPLLSRDVGSQMWLLELPQGIVHHNVLMELSVTLALASGAHCIGGRCLGLIEEQFALFAWRKMIPLQALEEILPEGAPQLSVHTGHPTFQEPERCKCTPNEGFATNAVHEHKHICRNLTLILSHQPFLCLGWVCLNT